MKKDWKSGVYGFFDEPKVEVHEGQHVHVFKCNGRGCKLKEGIRRYINTKDTGSTGNLRKHVKACWGADVLQTADKAKDAGEVHNKLARSILRNGSITSAFEQKTGRKATYSNMPFTRSETRYIIDLEVHGFNG